MYTNMIESKNINEKFQNLQAIIDVYWKCTFNPDQLGNGLQLKQELLLNYY